MECPHCGAEVVAGNRFCHRCRKRVVPPEQGFEAVSPTSPTAARSSAPRPPRLDRPDPLFTGYPPVAGEIRRPGLVTLLAILDLVGGAFVAFVGVAVVAVAVASSDRSDVTVTLLVATFYLALGLVQIATGIGLWRLRSWGRLLQIAMSCLGLLGIPCGTVISILILVYMFKSGIKILFSEKTADELTPAEAREVARALQSSTGTVVIVVSLVVLLGVAMIGMIAAIAIPSLLRARVAANESVTLGRLRAVLSAEVAYSRGNGGYGDKPECLKMPSSCIPGVGAAAPFLDDRGRRPVGVLHRTGAQARPPKQGEPAIPAQTRRTRYPQASGPGRTRKPIWSAERRTRAPSDRTTRSGSWTRSRVPMRRAALLLRAGLVQEPAEYRARLCVEFQRQPSSSSRSLAATPKGITGPRTG